MQELKRYNDTIKQTLNTPLSYNNKKSKTTNSISCYINEHLAIMILRNLIKLFCCAAYFQADEKMNNLLSGNENKHAKVAHTKKVLRLIRKLILMF